MGLAKIGNMTVRIARAKPEEAGSGGDGEAKDLKDEISAGAGREAHSRHFLYNWFRLS